MSFFWRGTLLIGMYPPLDHRVSEKYGSLLISDGKMRLALCAGHHSTNTKKIYSAVLQNAKKKKYLTRNDAEQRRKHLNILSELVKSNTKSHCYS